MVLAHRHYSPVITRWVMWSTIHRPSSLSQVVFHGAHFFTGSTWETKPTFFFNPPCYVLERNARSWRLEIDILHLPTVLPVKAYRNKSNRTAEQLGLHLNEEVIKWLHFSVFFFSLPVANGYRKIKYPCKIVCGMADCSCSHKLHLIVWPVKWVDELDGNRGLAI